MTKSMKQMANMSDEWGWVGFDVAEKEGKLTFTLINETEVMSIDLTQDDVRGLIITLQQWLDADHA